MKPSRIILRQAILFTLTFFTSVALARLPSKVAVAPSDEVVVALDSSLEYYYGNADSPEALAKVRRQLLKVQAKGIPTRLNPVIGLNDLALKRALDAKVTEVAFVSPKVKECSFAVMTVLALTQGKCAKRPVPPPRPTIELTISGGTT